LDQCLGTHGAAEPPPGRRAGGGDVDVAVGRLEDARRDAGWMVVAGLAWHLLRVEPARALEIEHEDLRLQKRGGHLLALARLLALKQRHQDAERTEETGREIGDRDADPHRASTGLAGDGHEAAHALRDLVEAGPVAVGTVLAEARDAGVDEARIEGAQ